jgi:hypothetical protein
MDIILFSNNLALHKKFLAGNMHKINLEVYTLDDIKKHLKRRNEPSLIYLDVSDMEESEIKKYLRYLSNLKNIHFGLIDEKGAVNDVAEVFHAGGVDYLKKKNISEGINLKRLKLINEYLANYRRDFIPPPDSLDSKSGLLPAYVISENGWVNIREGREYTFSILFIELDNIDELSKNYNKKNLEKALLTFKHYLEKHVIPYDGKFLFWTGFGGVILFPFNGKDSQAGLCAFKIMLYKFLHDIEESVFPHLISFRQALHLGNLIYYYQNTGEIIADAINFIFHLGRKLTPPGQFYMTEEMLKFTPLPLHASAKTVGEFEGRTIYKIKRPVLPRVTQEVSKQ